VGGSGGGCEIGEASAELSGRGKKKGE